MFNFDIKQAEIYSAIKLESIFKSIGFFRRIFKFLFIVLFLLFLFDFLFDFLFYFFSLEISSILLGTSVICLTLSVSSLWKKVFFDLKLKNPKIKIKILDAITAPEKYNLAELLDFNSAKTIFKAIKFVRSKKNKQINSSVLFYHLLTQNPKLNFVFGRAILDTKKIKKNLEENIKNLEKKDKEDFYAQDFQEIILSSMQIAFEKNRDRVVIGDILMAVAQRDPIFKQILIDAKLKTDDIKNLVWWQESLEKRIQETKDWWKYKNLLKGGSVGKEWASGYRVTLDKYSTDITDEIRRMGFREIIGHKDVIRSVERALSHSGLNSVLLVGRVGVGIKNILYSIAQKSFLGIGSGELNNKRIIELNMSSLLARVEDAEETEAILDRIFQEVVSAGNIILVISKFHNFVGSTAKMGVVDISAILSSYLKFPQFQVIATTNYVGLHKNIEKNPSILTFFRKVEVSEVSREETIMLLENLALELEAKHNIMISYPAIRDVFVYSDRYMLSKPFPKKAIDLLDEAMVYASRSTKDNILLPKHVARVVSEKIEIPVGEIEEEEKDTLLNLENLIHRRIVNQNEAINEVSTALRRARAEVSKKKGPMGCFLFLGPSGVGKTETAKALAEIYFKSEERMIRIDMSEFQEIKEISRLIGSAEHEGLLTTQVRENPFSLILLDEIEKAHPNILNIFLQVLDEGHLTDGFGRKVSFLNTMIIATSNAGYKVILDALDQKTEWALVKQKLLDRIFERAIFRPEFINRFDAMVVFQPLNKENLLKISEFMFRKLKKGLKEKDIEFIITRALKEKVVELGYNPTFGARNMKRVIQDKVENVLAQALLRDELKGGDTVEIEPTDEKFKLKIK